MGLDPGGGADHQHGGIQHLEGPLHLPGEVHVARGVQQGDLRLRQGQQGLLGEDGDAPTALLLVGVQEGVPVVHPAQSPQLAGGVEQGLRQGGLARVHVGQYADHQFLHRFAPAVPS